jgi:hypothetical protein
MARNFNHPPKNLEDHPLLDVHNCLINMSVYSLYIWRPYPSATPGYAICRDKEAASDRAVLPTNTKLEGYMHFDWKRAYLQRTFAFNQIKEHTIKVCGTSHIATIDRCWYPENS